MRTPTRSGTRARTHTHTHKYVTFIAFLQQQWIANTPQCFVTRALPVLFDVFNVNWFEYYTLYWQLREFFVNWIFSLSAQWLCYYRQKITYFTSDKISVRSSPCLSVHIDSRIAKWFYQIRDPKIYQFIYDIY